MDNLPRGAPKGYAEIGWTFLGIGGPREFLTQLHDASDAVLYRFWLTMSADGTYRTLGATMALPPGEHRLSLSVPDAVEPRRRYPVQVTIVEGMKTGVGVSFDARTTPQVRADAMVYSIRVIQVTTTAPESLQPDTP